jgi:phospholipid/cholesterol/gamma-HCH transport system substrate-binding protein
MSHAVVGLSIQNSLALHEGTDVGIRWKNVIGQKELYLYPNSAGPVIKTGATIPLSHDVSDASINDFLNSFGPFLSAVNPQEANEFVENVSGALQGDTVEIDQLLSNGATVSQTIGNLDTQVGVIIDSLNQVLGAIASRSGDVSSLVNNIQTVAASLSSKNAVLDDVVTNLGQVAGDLGNLIGSNRSNLDTTINDLESVSTLIEAHQSELAATLSTLGSGLAPYIEISSYGQWFNIQGVYLCLANQQACNYVNPAQAPSGSGPLGGSPLPSPLDREAAAARASHDLPVPGVTSLRSLLNGMAGLAAGGTP